MYIILNFEKSHLSGVLHRMSTMKPKGAFKYYVIKEVGGWVDQMMMFDDKVGWWEWLNDDVIKKYTRKKNFSSD